MRFAKCSGGEDNHSPRTTLLHSTLFVGTFFLLFFPEVYLAIVLCLGVLATLLTGWVLSLYHRHPSYPMSTIMRVVVARVLLPLRDWTCCRRLGKDTQVQPAFTPSEKLKMGQSRPASLGKEHGREEVEVGSPRGKIKTVLPPTQEAEVRLDEESTWQEVAAMFDRLFLILYLIIIAVVSGTILVLLYQDYY